SWIAPSTSITSGTWTIRLLSQTSGTHRADFWFTHAEIATAPFFVQGRTESRLVTSPATGDSVIAVGAYVTRRSWGGVNGSSYVYMDAVMECRDGFTAAAPSRDDLVSAQITTRGRGVAT